MSQSTCISLYIHRVTCCIETYAMLDCCILSFGIKVAISTDMVAQFLLSCSQHLGIASKQWQKISFAHAFASPPAFLTSIQTLNNENGLPGSSSEPWFTVPWPWTNWNHELHIQLGSHRFSNEIINSKPWRATTTKMLGEVALLEIRQNEDKITWRFPEIGVPLNHPFRWDFPL